jgi:hypothetical protein
MVEKAYRYFAKKCHSDLWPGIPKEITDGAFRRITAARDAILQDIASGTGGPGGFGFSGFPGFTSPQTPFYVLMAVSGAGKTREWSRMTAENCLAGTEYHIIIACPTIVLMDEVEQYLKELHCDAPKIIHSRMGIGANVRSAMINYLYAMRTMIARRHLLLITHVAMSFLPPPVERHKWDLVIDEIPDWVETLEQPMRMSSSYIINHVEGVSFCSGVVHVKPLDLRDVAWFKSLSCLSPKEDKQIALFRPLARALIDPGKVVLALEERWVDLVAHKGKGQFGGYIEFIVVVDPYMFEGFKSLSLMAARADRTLLYILWTKVFGVQFAPMQPLQSQLVTKHTNGHRLTIYYAWEERQTRSSLERKMTNGKTAFMCMCDIAATVFKGVDFVWSAPQPTEDGGVRDNFYRSTEERHRPFDPALRLPGKTHGLNKFRDYHHIAMLSVLNLRPDVYTLLHLLGLTNEEIDSAFGGTALYQELMRTALRDLERLIHEPPRFRKDYSKVSAFVPDLWSAEQLAAELPGCKIERVDENFVPQRARPGQKRKPPDKAEKMRAYRARKRAEREQKEQQRKEGVE